eukprot:1172364-Amphidinium_carterae.2
MEAAVCWHATSLQLVCRQGVQVERVCESIFVDAVGKSAYALQVPWQKDKMIPRDHLLWRIQWMRKVTPQACGSCAASVRLPRVMR